MYTRIEDIPGHKSAISTYITAKLASLGVTSDIIDGFVIDSGKPIGKMEGRRIAGLMELFPTARIVILQTVQDVQILRT